jgi:hypothetical protein
MSIESSNTIVTSERPHFGQRGNARQLKLDRIRHQAFDFRRRQTRRFGDHLHQYAGHVRKCVDGDGSERVDAAGADNDGDDHNEKALAERKVEETRDHQACFFRSSDFKTKAP